MGRRPADRPPRWTVRRGHDAGLHRAGHDSRRHRLDQRGRSAARRMATFDAAVNNTDRKGGHILPVEGGRHVYGVDHGVCFSATPKLRTVLWGWRGEPLLADELAGLERIREALNGDLGVELRRCSARARCAPRSVAWTSCSPEEVFPLPSPTWPAIPGRPSKASRVHRRKREDPAGLGARRVVASIVRRQTDRAARRSGCWRRRRANPAWSGSWPSCRSARRTRRDRPVRSRTRGAGSAGPAPGWPAPRAPRTARRPASVVIVAPSPAFPISHPEQPHAADRRSHACPRVDEIAGAEQQADDPGDQRTDVVHRDRKVRVDVRRSIRPARMMPTARFSTPTMMASMMYATIRFGVGIDESSRCCRARRRPCGWCAREICTRTGDRLLSVPRYRGCGGMVDPCLRVGMPE